MRTSLLVLSAAVAVAGCAVDVPEAASTGVNICCGENCCLIELPDNPCSQTCWANGQRNCVNPCQECNVAVNDSAWTDIAGCTFDAGMPDAGPIDAGPLDAGASDAGPIEADLGPIEEDAGPRPADQGSVMPVDAGTSGTTDSMGCAVNPRGGSGAGLGVLLVGLGLLLRRRR